MICSSLSSWFCLRTPRWKPTAPVKTTNNSKDRAQKLPAASSNLVDLLVRTVARALGRPLLFHTSIPRNAYRTVFGLLVLKGSCPGKNVSSFDFSMEYLARIFNPRMSRNTGVRGYLRGAKVRLSVFRAFCRRLRMSTRCQKSTNRLLFNLLDRSSWNPQLLLD